MDPSYDVLLVYNMVYQQEDIVPRVVVVSQVMVVVNQEVVVMVSQEVVN